MLVKKTQKVRQLASDAVATVVASKAAIDRHRYSTPLFVLRQALSAFNRHNGFGIAASLSFYAMFAMIPMALLIFFLLSHFAVSSSYAIAKLTVLVSHLVPKYSHRIMIEVYNISRQKAIWGVFGMFGLLWVSKPLAGALQNAFFTIAGEVEQRSFLRRNVEDVFGVLGILLLFFLFSFSGLMLEKVIGDFTHLPWFAVGLNWLGSLLVSAVLMTLLSRTFYPGKVYWKHLFLGSFITVAIWSAMRPAFGLFMAINHSYSTVFGGMKSLFLSIGWLYSCFAVLLLGIEIIAALNKRQVLMLKGLFTGAPTDTEHYYEKLMMQFGRVYQKGNAIFRSGETERDMFYVLSGKVVVQKAGRVIRTPEAGTYFGEMSFLTGEARTADAYAAEDGTQVVAISPENLEMLLLAEPQVAVDFLKQMAQRLHDASSMR
ncbi:MAG TPA: YhjD/YihY/BrkB family envelope integrity protein [Methylophilaceae bacterium]|jgi:membrane protein